MKSKSLSDRKVQLTLASAILCVVVVTFASFRGMAVSDASEARLRHTHRVLETLQDLLLAADEVDSSSREYGMSGQASELQSYRTGEQSVQQDLKNLRELSADNPTQLPRIAGLEWLVSQKLSRAEAIIRLQGANDFDAMEDAGKKNPADIALDNLFQRSVREARREELRLLILRDSEAKWRLSVVKALLIVATSMGLLIAVLAMWSRYRETVQRNLARIALHDSEEKYRSLLDGIQDYSMFMLDPAGTITSWNAGAERMHGYTAKEIVGQNFSCLFPAEDVQRRRPQEILRLADKRDRYQDEILHVRRDGSNFIAEVALTPMRDSSGKLRGFSKISRDLTPVKQAESNLVKVKAQLADLTHLAEHDPLTGLPNRLFLNDRIEQGIALASRHSGKVAVLFLDLDGFKRVNDSHGHAVGDELLCSVAKRLQACVRTPDTVIRNGGDEFILVIQEMKQPNQASITARRVLETLADPHMVGELELQVTASVGVSVYPDDGQDAETLIKNADTAMYQAKTRGREKFQFYTLQMDDRAIKRGSD